MLLCPKFGRRARGSGGCRGGGCEWRRRCRWPSRCEGDGGDGGDGGGGTAVGGACVLRTPRQRGRASRYERFTPGDAAVKRTPRRTAKSVCRRIAARAHAPHRTRTNSPSPARPPAPPCHRSPQHTERTESHQSRTPSVSGLSACVCPSVCLQHPRGRPPASHRLISGASPLGAQQPLAVSGVGRVAAEGPRTGAPDHRHSGPRMVVPAAAGSSGVVVPVAAGTSSAAPGATAIAVVGTSSATGAAPVPATVLLLLA